MELKCDGKHDHPNDCSHDQTIKIKCGACEPSEQMSPLAAVQHCRVANNSFSSQAISKTVWDDIN